MTSSEYLYKTLRKTGLDFMVSVPCVKLGDLIAMAEKDQEITYTPVTREEEGIGILAGAALAGKRPAILMQNSGLGNSVNALCSLVSFYSLPMVLVISHRGTEGEMIKAQIPMGETTRRILEAADISHLVVYSAWDLLKAESLIDSAFRDSRPAALLLPFDFWDGGNQK